MRDRLIPVVIAALLATTLVASAAVSTVPVANTITVETNSGVTVATDDHGGQQALRTPFPDAQTVEIITDNGNVTVSGNSTASVEIDGFDPLVAKNLDLTNGPVTFDPEYAPPLTVEGQTDNFTYYTPAIDDGSADLRYAGQSGDTTVTFHGLQPDTTVSAIDTQNGGQVLDTGTTDSNGNVTLTLPNSEHTVELQSGDQSSPPDLANLNPSGPVTDDSITAAVDVDDADFSGTDDVTVEFYVDGSKVGSTTVSSAQTVTESVSNIAGGSHNLTAVATDTFGNRDKLETTFTVPSNLTVVNESDTAQTIADANVTIFIDGNQTVFTRTSDTNGNVSLEGLPLNRPVTVEVRHPDYYTRTYVFDSLGEQHTAYLLPTSATVANITYILDDQTGEFDPPQETALLIRKPVNTSSGTQYVTVVSDRFDATEELPVRLEVNQRYRLQVRAPDGELRSIGNYRVTGDDPNAVLTIGTVRLAGSVSDGVGFGAALQDEAGNRVVRYQFADPDQTTAALNVTIYETGNKSNVLLNETTVATDLGTFTEAIIVPSSAPGDIAYTVKYEATLDNGDVITGKRYVGDVPEVAEELGLDPNVLSLLGWGTLLALTGAVAIASASVAAVVATVTATALTWIGALPIPAPLLGIAGAISVLMMYARQDL